MTRAIQMSGWLDPTKNRRPGLPGPFILTVVLALCLVSPVKAGVNDFIIILPLGWIEVELVQRQGNCDIQQTYPAMALVGVARAGRGDRIVLVGPAHFTDARFQIVCRPLCVNTDDYHLDARVTGGVVDTRRKPFRLKVVRLLIESYWSKKVSVCPTGTRIRTRPPQAAWPMELYNWPVKHGYRKTIGRFRYTLILW